MAFGKKREESGSIDEEREALREQRGALEELKRELAERVQALRERERELEDAVAHANGGTPPSSAPAARPDSERAALAARAAELDRREEALQAREKQRADNDDKALSLERRARELDERERALAQREALGSDPDEAKLRKIEARLTELRHAEKLFVRTQSELAVRSEAITMRERLVTQRERELDEREDADALGPRELSQLEARLRRLEQQDRGDEIRGFSGGLRKLQQSGTHKAREDHAR